MRSIEIEISDQSDVLLSSVLKESIKKNKFSVQSIIDFISFSSSNYSSINVLFRTSKTKKTLSFISQTSLSLFHLFFSFNVFEIMIKNINLKTSKRDDSNNVKSRWRVWHDTSVFEVEIFLRILLYMNYTSLSRIADY